MAPETKTKKETTSLLSVVLGNEDPLSGERINLIWHPFPRNQRKKGEKDINLLLTQKGGYNTF